MKGRGERSVMELYDRTPPRPLHSSQSQAPAGGSGDGGAGGRAEVSGSHQLVIRMEDAAAVRKRPISSGSPHMSVEYGTCTVCSAPCSSCLHRGLALVDSNVECRSSQTCCERTETDKCSFIGSDKGARSKGIENGDEFSATSSHASYSETTGNKGPARSSIAGDSSEVNMPAKRRRLLNQETTVRRAECHDDSNSCVTGVSAAGELPLDKKRGGSFKSASSRGLLAKDCTSNNTTRSQNPECQISHSRQRNTPTEEATRKRSNVHETHTGPFDKLVPAESPSIVTKKLLRTASSISPSGALSPQRPQCALVDSQNNLPLQSCGQVSLSNNYIEHLSGGKLAPHIISADKHETFPNCATSNRNKISGGSSSKDLEIDMSCPRNEVQEAEIHSKNGAKKNSNGKQDQKQDCSMNAASDKKSKMQTEVVTERGNYEGLIDVNVCDICGDVGREYLLVTCTTCLEGAEHTYCMRVKLEKVPDGDWLCEECQLNEAHDKIRSNYNASTANLLDVTNKKNENLANAKKLQAVVTGLEAKQITCAMPVIDLLDGTNENSENSANCKKFEARQTSSGTTPAGRWDEKNQNRNSNFVSTDPEAQQASRATPTAEKLDGKNKHPGNMANFKKLKVVSSDTKARTSTFGTPTAGNLYRKNSSEFITNRKKLQVAIEMEAPPSNEDLQSPAKSCKRHAESPSSLSVRRISEMSPRLLETGSPRKHGSENSLKKSDSRSLKLADNASARTGQVVKGSLTLMRSYSLGNMRKVKAQIPSPRGVLSKQLSNNNLNNGPKVKELAGGATSKLRPVEQSPRDPRGKGPIRKVMKSGSFKNEDSVCKDTSSLKQKQPSHFLQSEKPRILKPMREKNLLERRASFSIQKPNIPPPKPDGSMKDLKINLDNVKSGSSKLKTSKISGSFEKKQSLHFSKSEKLVTTKVLKPVSVVKDDSTVKRSDPLIPRENANEGITNNGADEAVPSKILLKSDDEMSTKSEALAATQADMICETTLQDAVPRASTSDNLTPKGAFGQQMILEGTNNDAEKAVPSKILVKNDDKMPSKSEALSAPQADVMYETALQDSVPRASTSDDLTPKGECGQQMILEGTEDNSCKNAEAVPAPEDLLVDNHGLPMEYNLHPPDNTLNELDLKPLAQEFGDQPSILGNPFRALVIPEQSYIWRGSFEVSRPGKSPEIFDGIQAHLSTCVSSKVLEVVKQLPHIIQMVEVPCLRSWPLQFKELKQSQDNIALFFFAKDLESYERTYGKLLENMLVYDSSLTANICGIELLIFPSDKLPEKCQRWNGLLFLWGVFYARKASNSKELPGTKANHCLSIPSTESVVQRACSPKLLPSLGIDLNMYPDDEFFGAAVSPDLEVEKYAASGDHMALFDSKHEDRKLDEQQTHIQENASTRQVVSGSAVSTASKAHSPTSSTGDCRIKIPDYAGAVIGITGTTIRDKIEEEGCYMRNKTLFCVEQQTDLISPTSNKVSVRKRALLPFTDAHPQHSRGSKVCDEASESVVATDFVLFNGASEYKRQKTCNGAHSSCSLGDKQLVGRHSSKIHPLPADQHNLSLDDGEYIYGGPVDPASSMELIPDHVIHVLSSDDDEDSPESKVEEGLTPLLSLSLSRAGSKHDLASATTGGDDGSLSLSLGLPSMVNGKQAVEMQQFWPEKSGINTSLLL